MKRAPAGRKNYSDAEVKAWADRNGSCARVRAWLRDNPPPPEWNAPPLEWAFLEMPFAPFP